LVHYSSDYVYPDTGSAHWQANSTTGPLSGYGQTKLEGDEAIQRSGAEDLIFRTSWVYSARVNNFMKTMLRLDMSQLKKTLNIQVPDWQSQLVPTLKEYLEK
jgi:dTDP-4-dehydrorhamnose reductase